MNNCDVFFFFLFLLKTLIVCTRLNRRIEAVLTSTHNLCFRAKIRKYVYPFKPQFYYIKVGVRGYVTRACHPDVVQMTENNSNTIIQQMMRLK